MLNLDNYADFWTTDLKKYRLLLTTSIKGANIYAIQHLSSGGLVMVDEEADMDGKMHDQIIQKMLENDVEVLDIRSFSDSSFKKSE